jgi:hypothetical protein
MNGSVSSKTLDGFYSSLSSVFNRLGVKETIQYLDAVPENRDLVLGECFELAGQGRDTPIPSPQEEPPSLWSSNDTHRPAVFPVSTSACQPVPFQPGYDAGHRRGLDLLRRGKLPNGGAAAENQNRESREPGRADAGSNILFAELSQQTDRERVQILGDRNALDGLRIDVGST